MEIVCKTDGYVVTNSVLDNQVTAPGPSGPYQQNNNNGARISCPDDSGPNNSQSLEQRHQNPQQQQQQKAKRKHRRGKPKPKPKNANKAYKKTNWKFQIPRLNYNYKGGNVAGGIGTNGGSSNETRARLTRSQSLVPYNTNKFLMEEHLAEVPSSLLTPGGRTRDSSFSVDSDDNYFFSLPEDEEEFLTKEFDNIYEKARLERLESLTKQQLIEECVQIEDRYSTDQGTRRQQQLNIQRISFEFMAKIRSLEEKIRELTRENFDLRSQLMRSAALAAAASPPSATAPTASAYQPTPIDSLSEDSESDSSTSSSSSASSASFQNADNAMEEADDECQDILNEPAQDEIQDYVVQEAGLQNYGECLNAFRSTSSSRSSLSEYDMPGIYALNPEDELQDQMLEEDMEAYDQSNNSNDIQHNNSSYIDAVDVMVEETADPNSVKNRSPSSTSRVPQTPP